MLAWEACGVRPGFTNGLTAGPCVEVLPLSARNWAEEKTGKTKTKVKAKTITGRAEKCFMYISGLKGYEIFDRAQSKFFRRGGLKQGFQRKEG